MAKAGYFQENWAHAFETAQGSSPVVYSPITPIDHNIPMVSDLVLGFNSQPRRTDPFSD
jgi:hypothetical protein